MHAKLMLAATVLAVTAPVSHVLAQPELVVKDGKVTIPMILKPADYARPLSRTLLLPDYSESIPGNRVQMFLRCFMEQTAFFGQEESDKRDAWNKLPLREVPASLQNYGGNLITRAMYDAARMLHVDWQLWYFVRRDQFGTLLPDVQKMRSLIVPMKTRLRGQLSSQDYPGSIHTLKTMFGLCRTLENHPTLIGYLVGLAIGVYGADGVEEFIQQPGAPNLFWSLTSLPNPLISLRSGAEGERVMFDQDLEKLKSSENLNSDAEIQRIVQRVERILSEGLDPGNQVEAGLLSRLIQDRVKNSEDVQKARKNLSEMGITADKLEDWTPLRIVVLNEYMQYEKLRDEQLKWINLPYYSAKAGLDSVAHQIKAETAQTPMLKMLPAVEKVKRAQARLDQRIAYLQILEAIRLHAFSNGGKLPNSLDQIKLPLSADPVSGKPFEYSVTKNVAILHGMNPGEGPETNRYYLIMLAK
ncbi:hypothetical protein BH10PLA2_BH10PLA2_33990 [soil metagenome]